MREHLINFMEKLDFPPEARKALLKSHACFESNPDGACEMHGLIEAFYAGGRDVHPILEALNGLAEMAGVHPYTAHLLFFIYCAKRLRETYRASGIPEDVFWNSMLDLRCKLMECHEVYGVWGTFVGWWFKEFYTLQRFGLGRLQYEYAAFGGDSLVINGHEIRRGDRAFGVHIPSCGPLTREKRLDSYRKAHAFFKDELKDGLLVLVCESWLLYPENETFFPKGSNIIDFMHDFHIIRSYQKDTFDDAWRVFGRDYSKPINEWPAETSLQRAIAGWLRAGRKTGMGCGVLLFDGRNVL